MTPVEQFRTFIIRPALTIIDLWSVAAEDLVLGTAVHESGGLKYFEQITGNDDTKLGPALGFFQIERATHDDLWANFLNAPSRWLLRANLRHLMTSEETARQLMTNLSYGAAICRLIYYRRPEALPAEGDIDGYAKYYKNWYNTSAGKATPEQWAAAYRKLCV